MWNHFYKLKIEEKPLFTLFTLEIYSPQKNFLILKILDHKEKNKGKFVFFY